VAEKKTKEEATVTLALAPSEWTIMSFDPQVEGVEPITHEGTEVPADKEQDIRTRARVAGVSLRKEG